MLRSVPPAVYVLVALVALSACDAASTDDGFDMAECAVSNELFVSGGVPKDGIPALTDPPLVAAGAADYLTADSRVVGVVVDGRALAVPHNVLWQHEIANVTIGGSDLAVTYCPLTGSSLAFDRSVVGGAAFGVSGLLFQNNLTMYDRTGGESLWPQMHRAAGCGPQTGTPLAVHPVVEMTWAGWTSLHPDTQVLSAETGHERIYFDFTYPYGDYEEENNARLLQPMTRDRRRPPKERVLGIPDGAGGGLAVPFGALRGDGPKAVHEKVGGAPVVVFWDDGRRAAAAYRPSRDGAALTFEVREGRIVDRETESTWRIDGRAVEGPLAGTQLAPVAEAYVAFWFAWAAFQPHTRIWGRGMTGRGIVWCGVLVAAAIGCARHASAQWVEAPGTGWVQAAVYHLDTRRSFGPDGHVRPLFADGHAVATSLYVTAVAGVVAGVDAWVQAPLHRLRYDDALARRSRTGPGDVRLHLRAGPALFGWRPVPVAVRAGVKLPGGDFPIDAEVIPLGEGQRDWELILEVGRSWWPRTLWAMGWAGYRWREENARAAQRPGDERFAYLAVGGRVGGFDLKVSAEGLWGRPPRIQGVVVPSGRRRVVQLLPSVGHVLGPGTIEVGVRAPVAGRNVPAGVGFYAGYFTRWRLR